MEGAYGKGKSLPEAAKPDRLPRYREHHPAFLPANREPGSAPAAWEGWHTIAPPMQKDYARFVELSNKGARELGFADTGAMWRSQLRHAARRVRRGARPAVGAGPAALPVAPCLRALKLREKYGDVVPANGPIPAHLLGNIWAQDWSNIYSLVAPPARTRLFADRDPEVRARCRRSRWSAPASASSRRSASSRCRRRSGSARCSRSPSDREVVCHASAWDVDYAERPAHQDVHRPDGRGLHDHPSRARPQLLPARLQARSRRSSATAPMTASTKRSATPSRCR